MSTEQDSELTTNRKSEKSGNLQNKANTTDKRKVEASLSYSENILYDFDIATAILLCFFPWIIFVGILWGEPGVLETGVYMGLFWLSFRVVTSLLWSLHTKKKEVSMKDSK
jgi:hypothetical protein